MRQYSELSSIIQSVLAYRLSHLTGIRSLGSCIPLQPKDDVGSMKIDRYSEPLQYWIATRYAHLPALDQLLLLLYGILEEILDNQKLAIPFRKLRHRYLTTHLQVLLNHYFQLSRLDKLYANKTQSNPIIEESLLG